MDATTVVAIYAATVATGSVLIQFAVWRTTHTRVRLHVNPGTGPVQGESDGAGGFIRKDADVVFIDITNQSGHPVRISQIWATRSDDPESHFVFLDPYPRRYQTFPLGIPARDSRTIWVLQKGIPTDRPLRFRAKTTADDEFETKPIVVDDLPRFNYSELGADGGS